MARKVELSTGEYYHVYNRGVDKRNVFEDKQDFFQFLEMINYFNITESFGSIKEYKYPKNLKHRGSTSVLVEIIAYCLNPNHFHLILKQKEESGVSKFMQKLGTGYTMYFNKKNDRSGSLFQGRFKSKHIKTDVYLKHLSVYVNLNFKVHNIKVNNSGEQSFRSSYLEYINNDNEGICQKKVLLGHENERERQGYKKFAERTIKNIISDREKKREGEFE